VRVEREDEAEECVLRRCLFCRIGIVRMACVRSKCGRRQMMVNYFEARFQVEPHPSGVFRHPPRLDHGESICIRVGASGLENSRVSFGSSKCIVVQDLVYLVPPSSSRTWNKSALYIYSPGEDHLHCKHDTSAQYQSC